MSDDELSRIEQVVVRAVKRYIAQYWWGIVPALIGGTIWVTHQNSISEDTLTGLRGLRSDFAAFSAAQHQSELVSQRTTDELARHEWTATNHENRLQWLEHRRDSAHQ